MRLTVRDAAALLRSSESQIYKWVEEARIPCQRVRDQIRFNRADLLEWATARGLPVALAEFDDGLDPEDQAPSLAGAFRRGGVHHDVPATDRDSALRGVVARTPMPESLDPEFVLAVLVAREDSVSTAIGDGIAVPHVRQPVVAPGSSPVVSVSYLKEPVQFGATEVTPVHTVFLLVSPTVRAHLRMLAHLARLLLDPGFRAALAGRAPGDQLIAEAKRIESARVTQSPLQDDRGAA